MRTNHSGTNEVLANLREEYWILKGRQAVKCTLRSCLICRRYEGSPYAAVRPPDLPDIRVSEDPPFSHTGIDFAGPLFLSCGPEVQTKAYIVSSPVPPPVQSIWN